MLTEAILKQIEEELEEGFEPTLLEGEIMVAEIRRLYKAYGSTALRLSAQHEPHADEHYEWLRDAFEPEIITPS